MCGQPASILPLMLGCGLPSSAVPLQCFKANRRNHMIPPVRVQCVPLTGGRIHVTRPPGAIGEEAESPRGRFLFQALGSDTGKGPQPSLGWEHPRVYAHRVRASTFFGFWA